MIRSVTTGTLLLSLDSFGLPSPTEAPLDWGVGPVKELMAAAFVFDERLSLVRPSITFSELTDSATDSWWPTSSLQRAGVGTMPANRHPKAATITNGDCCRARKGTHYKDIVGNFIC